MLGTGGPVLQLYHFIVRRQFAFHGETAGFTLFDFRRGVNHYSPNKLFCPFNGRTGSACTVGSIHSINSSQVST
jgi:hypothetical protein